MADENVAAEDDGDEDVAESSGGKKKKLILFGGVGLVVLLAAGAGGYFFLMGSDAPMPRSSDGGTVQEVQKPVVFYDLPEMTVNLATEGRTTYLKVRIAL
ncbi:MAG: flagellar basal body-associated protein FliL, partial [Roseibium sp.]